MLKREKIDISMERKVLSNLIMSTPLLAACRNVGSPSYFESTMGKAVAQWVWDFFDVSGEAPGMAIGDIYAQRIHELQEADRDMVHAFLSRASDEWLPANPGLAERMAVEYFQGRALHLLRERLERMEATNDVQGGLRAVAEFSSPEIVKCSVVDVFRDACKIRDAFGLQGESLFSFPSFLGRTIGAILAEDFIAFVAPPKRGKTWWLMATAMVAALQGLHVLFVSLEMPEPQMLRRFWQMLTGTSRHGEEAAWPLLQEDGNCYRVEDRKVPTRMVDLSDGAVEKMQQSLRRTARGGRLELMSFPTGSLSVAGLKNELKKLEVYSNFTPTLICIDYADIMDHGRGESERDRLNRTWLSLRGLAMERKCVVATASQSNRETVDGAKDASEKNLAEDIRKLAHVTKLVTINQTEEEKERGIYRLGCRTQREGQVVFDQVVCTNCLAIGRPWLECQLLSNVDMGTSEDYVPEERSQRRVTRGRR